MVHNCEKALRTEGGGTYRSFLIGALVLCAPVFLRAEAENPYPAPPVTMWEGPDGLVDWESLDAYVTDGLVAFYDGIQNAGDGLPHNPDAVTWVDRVSGATAGFAREIETRGPGRWTDGNAYTFSGDYARTDEKFTLGRTFTAQAVTTVFPGKGHQTARYPNILATPGDFSVFIYNEDEFKMQFKADPYDAGDRESRPEMSAWNGLYTTIMFTETEKLLFDGVTYANGLDRTESKSVGNRIWTWGGSDYRADNVARYTLGAFHGVRFYNRVLTEAELARNREVDEARYFNRVAVTNVVVAVSDLPCEGAEKAGVYTVKGAHTFTAPAARATAERDYALTGWLVETWDAAGRIWRVTDEGTVADGAAGSVTLAAADATAKRRITWRWRVTRGVRAGYTIDDYVQEGLVVNYDGERNAGPGMPHNGSTDYWMDAAGSGDYMTFSNRADRAQGAWLDNGYDFQGGTYACMAKAIGMGSTFTTEQVLDVTASDQLYQYPNYLAAYSELGTFTSNKGRKLTWKNDTFTGASASAGGRPIITVWDGKYITCVLTATNAWMFQGTVYENEGIRQAGFPGVKNCTWSIACAANAATEPRYMIGKIYATRFYNRALTEAELARNRRVDECRFRGAGLGVTNVVVAANAYGVTAAEAPGAYEVEGVWTFTAEPRTLMLNDKKVAFTPTGYTLETWEDGAWGAPARHAGTSYTHTAAAVPQPVRLTWLYDRNDGTLLVVR